jgi:hypothetical protein
LNVSPSFTSAPQTEAIWVLKVNDLVPQKFRALGIIEPRPGIVEITGLEYNSGKYAWVEQGLKLEDPPITVIDTTKYVEPPSSLTLTQEIYTVSPQVKNYRIVLSFLASPSNHVVGYRVEWRPVNGNWTILSEDSSLTRHVDNVTPGDYEVRVQAINGVGVVSVYISDSITVSASQDIPPDVANLRCADSGSTTFDAPDCRVVWDSVLTAAFPTTFFKHYVVEILDGVTPLRTEYVVSPEFVYTFGKNYDDNAGVPIPSFTVRVKAEGWDGQFSASPSSIVVTNPAPPTPVVSVDYEMIDAILTWDPVTALDHLKTVVKVYPTAGDRTAGSNEKRSEETQGGYYNYSFAKNSADFPTHPNPWTVYIRVLHEDVFGQTSYDDVDVTNSLPGIPSSVNLIPGFKQILISWTPPTNIDWDIVEIWQASVNDSSFATKVAESRGIMTIIGGLGNGETYYFWLRSRDTSGNPSPFDVAQYSGHESTTLLLDSGDLDPNSLNLRTIDIVTSLPPLPNVNYDEGDMVFLLTDKKLYRMIANPSPPPTWIWTVEVDGGDIKANTITGDSIIAGEIVAGHLTTSTAVITVTAQIANAIINDAKIVDLTVSKLTAGTIDVLIKLGVDNIELDGVNDIITIKDSQGTPVTRVRLGKVGAGVADWGLELYDSNGNLTFSATDTIHAKVMKYDVSHLFQRIGGPSWPFVTAHNSIVPGAASFDGNFLICQDEDAKIFVGAVDMGCGLLKDLANVVNPGGQVTQRGIGHYFSVNGVTKDADIVYCVYNGSTLKYEWWYARLNTVTMTSWSLAPVKFRESVAFGSDGLWDVKVLNYGYSSSYVWVCGNGETGITVLGIDRASGGINWGPTVVVSGTNKRLLGAYNNWLNELEIFYWDQAALRHKKVPISWGGAVGTTSTAPALTSLNSVSACHARYQGNTDNLWVLIYYEQVVGAADKGFLSLISDGSDGVFGTEFARGELPYTSWYALPSLQSSNRSWFDGLVGMVPQIRSSKLYKTNDDLCLMNFVAKRIYNENIDGILLGSVL